MKKKKTVSKKIHIMSTELANKIAAGEVIQRPASVVKELIENSLDAGARNITIVVKEAGKLLLHILDDGEGISEEDGMLLFKRHATSKIDNIEDLECLTTYGFRGEALASIAAVSQVELKTRREVDDKGLLLRVEANQVRNKSYVGIEVGTSISVKNLFFNTPARRQFLKTRQTELRNITDVVIRYAIAYPDVGWTYQSDDEILLNLKVKSIEERLIDIFSEEQFRAMMRLNYQYENILLDGFIGRPDFVRKSRIEQFLYLNKRFIYNKAINHAVFQAYEHLIPSGGYPFFILNIVVNPNLVDINVHPTKLEVKFADESAVYRSVLSSVKRTLKDNQFFPEVSLEGAESDVTQDERLKFIGARKIGFRAFERKENERKTYAEVFSFKSNREVPFNEESNEKKELNHFESTSTQAQTIPSSSRLDTDKVEEIGVIEGRTVWQIHNKYILSQIKSGLLIIDQHIAHERILYEKILATFENNLPSTQQLLFPQTIELTPADIILVKELAESLQSMGFVFKIFSKNTVVIDGLPSDVRVGDERKILMDVLDEYRTNEQRGILDIRENLAKAFACKAAIKAGDKLNTFEMNSLIDQLFATTMPYACPHGRPIVIKLTLEELDKRFGRTPQ